MNRIILIWCSLASLVIATMSVGIALVRHGAARETAVETTRSVEAKGDHLVTNTYPKMYEVKVYDPFHRSTVVWRGLNCLKPFEHTNGCVLIRYFDSLASDHLSEFHAGQCPVEVDGR